MLSPGNAALRFMPPLVLHAAKLVVYLGCCAVGAALGRAAAQGLASLLPVPPGVFFALLCILAGSLIGLVAPLEQRLVWGRWLTASDEDLAWIGKSSGNLLTGSIASPCSLGLALGLLSLLMA